MKDKWFMIMIMGVLLLSIFNHICYIYNDSIIDSEKKEIADKDTGKPVDDNVDLDKIETRIIINKVISFLCSITGIIFLVSATKRKEHQWEYFIICGIMVSGTLIMLLV